jgi:translation initiation factor 1
MSRRDGSRLVYSSEHGRVCPRCGRPQAACSCRKGGETPHGDGSVRIRREKKGRRGKTVTVISGLPLPADEIADLAGELKRRCGTGGSSKAGVIEIQGDHVETLMQELEARGHRPKRAGG